jgi:mannose-6-phosphate isomerase-like protein (cupin superfamily)
MTTTFIKTGDCAKRKIPGAGEVAEIMNEQLCGAKNGLGMLRWLGTGDKLDAQAKQNEHQLIYLMDGSAVIALNGKDYEVGKGAGIYLGPAEKASVRHAGSGTLKLFHLVVPKLAG